MSLDIEVTTWDEERVKDEITLRLDPGWVFKFGPSENQMLWEAIITSEDTEIWSGEGLTSQLVLLDALGWLENRRYKALDSSLWVRRRGDLNADRVHEIAYSKSYGPPDPPHLDPKEIQSVVQSVKKDR